ncbi:SCP2 sterol-binding domain-containing protein [Parvularcula sp. IMCC14364]|uniref:SCP2 sterol-binding domain-containing protein n=1 Tax=Parvularcula sp. IMCC14364 TaxID=3067902 RepID=UPI0027404922|nr:SCP2 sterol-binding domain-containing protein [Parvularcula sp. IMCC14364]
MSDILPSAASFFRQSFDGVIRIEIEGGGAIWIDGRQEPPAVTEQAPSNVDSSFCLWRTSMETLKRILSPGARQVEAAYVAGRLLISGDMSVMTRLETGKPQT